MLNDTKPSLPKLEAVQSGPEYVIVSRAFLTRAQAEEVIRRAEVHDELVEALEYYGWVNGLETSNGTKARAALTLARGGK